MSNPSEVKGCNNISVKVSNEDNSIIKSYVINTQQTFYEGDYFDLNTNEEVHCAWSKVVLTGTENWIIGANGSGLKYFYTSIPKASSYKLFSNKFKGNSDTYEGFWNDKVRTNKMKISSSLSQITLMLENCNTLAELKAFLTEQYNSDNPIYFMYKLDTPPTRIAMTEEQISQLKELESEENVTFENITHIYSEDEVSPIFTVEYYRDTKKVIENQQKEIDEIKALLSTTNTSAMLIDNLENDLMEEV